MDESQVWGEWRSLLHEIEPSFASLARARSRALEALAHTRDAMRERVADYAEAVIPMGWTFGELVEFWQAHVIDGERIGHIRLSEHVSSVRPKLLGEVTREDRHGLYVLMCEPFWVFVNEQTELVSQVLVNAPCEFATPDGLLSMGRAIHELREHEELVFSLDATWNLKAQPGVCFGPNDEDWEEEFDEEEWVDYEGRIEWIAVNPV